MGNKNNKITYKIILCICIAIIYIGMLWVFPYNVIEDKSDFLLIVGMVHLILFGGILFLIVMCGGIWKGFLEK